MAQDIVGSLFGVTPQAAQAAVTNPMFERAAAFAQMNPMQQAQFGLYSGGAMLGQGVAGLLGGEDPRLVQARQMQQVKDWIGKNNIDINSPEGLQQAAQYAQSIGATEGAMVLGQQARTISRAAAEEQLKLAQAEAALREKKGTPQSQAEQVRLNQLQSQFGEERGALEFMREQQELSERKAKAGAIQLPGQVKVPDIGTFRGDVRSSLNPLDEQFKAAQFALNQVKLVRGGNMKAVGQLDRALATLVGDKQLGQAEVAMLANNGSFPDRVVAGYQKFVTGGPTAMSLAEKEAVVEAAQNQAALNYNKTRDNLINVWSTANLPSQTVLAGVGEPKVSSLMQKQQQKQETRGNMGITQQPTSAPMPKFTVGQKFTKADGTVVTRGADGKWR